MRNDVGYLRVEIYLWRVLYFRYRSGKEGFLSIFKYDRIIMRVIFRKMNLLCLKLGDE